MWQIEQRIESDGPRATRWVPVQGERHPSEGAARDALRDVLSQAGRDAKASGQPRTNRFRIVPVVETCAVMQ